MPRRNSVTLADVQAAAQRLRDSVAVTPCPESAALSALTGATVFCKLDNLQTTGSFKERGARHALLRLPAANRKRGVIAASAGNHALGLALHGGRLGIPVTVVVPEGAPLIKLATCARLGANVVVHGTDFAAARAHALDVGRRQRLTYVHGYDDLNVIAGQGTIGLEILAQVPDVDAILVPVGGGGLIAGISVAIKALAPQVRIIGIESEATACFTAALRAGRPVKTHCRPTLADGLAVSEVGANAFTLARHRIDEVVVVSEEAIALAILRLLELEKTVTEGAAAAPLAALLSGAVDHMRGKRVVLVIGGGNIDPAILGRVIDLGLVADGRLTRFTVTTSDRPGGLAALTRAIAAAGASIRDITHDRAFGGPDVSAVTVTCVVETRDREHATALLQRLRRASFHPQPIPAFAGAPTTV